MRRWNGWGDETVSFELPEGATQLLEQLIGEATPPSDATLDEIVRKVPPSRLPPHSAVSDAPEDRLRLCRGQSFPDWLALRTGRIETFPDGIARPETDGDVRDLLRYAEKAEAAVIPYGGGTSVLGHINPIEESRPVLTVDLSRLDNLRSLDFEAHLATFGAGTPGPVVEKTLARRGFTLGHFPQSFELSTVGGWVATRSSGQQSLYYGRIEDLFAGGRLQTPVGTFDMPPYPASAAGPDLRQMVLGSEGRLGILTEVTVRVSSRPEFDEFHSIFFPDWERALLASREIVQAGLPLSMLRLSTSVETATTLAMAGHKWLVAGLERILALRGIGDSKCMLMLGATGSRAIARAALRESLGIAGAHDGWHMGQTMGRAWYKNRFHAPYLRNSLWELGYGVDTLETAIDWSGVSPMIEAIVRALNTALDETNEKVHIFTHLSHFYPSGSNIYVTFIFRLAENPEATLERWMKLKKAASKAIVARGGTISHQHGVGLDHKNYLAAEKGDLGMELLGTVCRCFDPKNMMNPGKLMDMTDGDDRDNGR